MGVERMKIKHINIIYIFILVMGLVMAVAPTLYSATITPNEEGHATALYGYCNFTDTESSGLYVTYQWDVNGVKTQSLDTIIADSNSIDNVAEGYASQFQGTCVGENLILVANHLDGANAMFLNKTDLSFVKNATTVGPLSYMCDADDTYFYMGDLNDDIIFVFNQTGDYVANLTAPSAHYGVREFDGYIYGTTGNTMIWNASDLTSVKNLTDEAYVSLWVPFVYNYDGENLYYAGSKYITFVYNVSDNWTLIANITSNASTGRKYGAVRLPGADWFVTYGDNDNVPSSKSILNIYNATTYESIENITLVSTKVWEAEVNGPYIFFSDGTYMDIDRNRYNLTKQNGESICLDDNYIIYTDSGDTYRTDKFISATANGNNLINTLTSANFGDEDNITFTCKVYDEESLSSSLSANYTVDIFTPEILSANLYTDSGNNYSNENIKVNATSIHTDRLLEEWKVNNITNLLGYWPMDLNNTYPVDRSSTTKLNFDGIFTTSPYWIVSGYYGGGMKTAASGNTGYECGDCITVEDHEDLTIEYWFKEPDTYYPDGAGTLLAVMKSYVYDIIIRIQAEDSYTILVRDNTSSPMVPRVSWNAASIRNDSNWHHSVWIIDSQTGGVNYSIYLDNDLKASTFRASSELNYTPGTRNIYIGLTYNNLSMDEVRIYNKTLSAEEIERSYLNSSTHYAAEHNATGNVSVILTPIDNAYIGTSVEVSMNNLSNFTYTLDVDYPKANVVHQRNTSDSKDILINGTTTGDPTQVKVIATERISGANTTQYLTVTSNAFAANMTLSKGEYNLSFYINDVEMLTQEVDNVGVGDIYMVGGQSNAAYTNSYDSDFTSTTNYSVWNCYGVNDFTTMNYTLASMTTDRRYARIAYEAAREENVPVMLFNIAKGGVSINWWRTTGIEIGVARYLYLTGETNKSIKASYYYQGETDIGNSKTTAYYYSELQLLLTSLYGNFSYYNNNESLVVSQVVTSGNDTKSPDSIRLAQQNAWYNLATVHRGSLNYDIYLGVNEVHPDGDERITADKRQSMAYLDYVFGTYEQPPIVQTIVRLNDTAMNITYNKQVRIGNWNGSVNGSLAYGYILENTDGSTSLNDSNVLSTTLEDTNTSIVVNFNSTLNPITNISICTGFTCYGDPVARSLTYDLPMEIVFDSSFTTESTNPLINFTTGTEANNSNVSQTFVFVNVSVTETYEANITFRLYNSSGIYNTTTYNDSTRTINWTGLGADNYTYNITVEDYSGNTNTTELRTINLETTAPNITLVAPVNATSSTTSAYNFTFNVTDTNTVSSCELVLGSTIYQTITTGINSSGTSGMYNSSIPTGTYVWYVNCTDNFGNEGNSSTRTLTVSAAATTTTTTTSSSSDENDYTQSASTSDGDTTTVYGGLDVTIPYDGTDYILDMDSSVAETTVDFTIEGTEYSMEEGDYIEIDLDGDGNKDISIKVEDIRRPYADLLIKELIVTEQVTPDVEEEPEVPTTEEIPEEIETTSNALYWIWASITILLLGFGSYLIHKKNS